MVLEQNRNSIFYNLFFVNGKSRYLNRAEHKRNLINLTPLQKYVDYEEMHKMSKVDRLNI